MYTEHGLTICQAHNSLMVHSIYLCIVCVINLFIVINNTGTCFLFICACTSLQALSQLCASGINLCHVFTIYLEIDVS